MYTVYFHHRKSNEVCMLDLNVHSISSSMKEFKEVCMLDQNMHSLSSSLKE